MKSALFLRVFLLHWPKRNCLSGRGCYETFLFSALCRAVRAGQSAAAGRIPAGQNRAGAFGTGVVRRGPGTGNARCRLSAALRPGQRDLPHCRPERWRGRVGAPPGLPHRGRGGGNAHHLAGRGAESPGHRGPQLRPLLPGPRTGPRRRLAHRRPGPAAGLSDRRRSPQLLGHGL